MVIIHLGTLQMGIGTILDYVLKCLENHQDLSVASEMISDGVVGLIEKGVITNRYKRFHPSKATCTFILGTKKLYDFLDDDPNVLVLDVELTNDPPQTSKGISPIVSTLKEGAGVTTTRAHVHYVVTEYGVANLFDKNYQQRARALIDIAHFDHREALECAVYQRFKNIY